MGISYPKGSQSQVFTKVGQSSPMPLTIPKDVGQANILTRDKRNILSTSTLERIRLSSPGILAPISVSYLDFGANMLRHIPWRESTTRSFTQYSRPGLHFAYIFQQHRFFLRPLYNYLYRGHIFGNHFPRILTNVCLFGVVR